MATGEAKLRRMKILRILLLAIFAALSLNALAQIQWQWIDKNGQKVFSDRAPPPDIPDNKILKRPGGQRATPVAAAPVVAAPAAASSKPALSASSPKLSTKDAGLEAKKKEAEEAEKAKVKALLAENQAKRAESCTISKKSLELINSGVRLRTTNAKGESEFMDDDQRAAESKRVQRIIDSDCK